MMIGIISDTHGLLRNSVIDNLKNCDLIIHAGDIGKIEVIKELEKISRVICVKGNCDKSIDMKYISDSEIVEVLGVKIYIIHNIKDIDMKEIEKLGIDIIIYGHSHKYEVSKIDNIIYINPGAIGPKRFKLPITMVKLDIIDENISKDNIKVLEISN